MKRKTRFALRKSAVHRKPQTIRAADNTRTDDAASVDRDAGRGREQGVDLYEETPRWDSGKQIGHKI